MLTLAMFVALFKVYLALISMKKLTLLRGLPASGKSTLAEAIVANGGTVRVNKDLIRTMLHYDKFTGKNESMTSEAEFAIAEAAVRNGFNVVVDDTNLNPRTLDAWKYWANDEDHPCRVEVIDVNTDIGECIQRDNMREKRVGEHVITKMALQYKDYMKGQKVVICDLDGTICDVEHRRHFLTDGPKKDWGSFFKEMDNDTLREDVIEQVMAALKEHNAKLIFVSARPEEYRERTMKWFVKQAFELNKVFPSFVTLLMRNDNDSREDSIIKSELYDKYLKNLDIVKVFDDRPRVIRMWRERGLDVVDVGSGEEF